MTNDPAEEPNASVRPQFIKPSSQNLPGFCSQVPGVLGYSPAAAANDNGFSVASRFLCLFYEEPQHLGSSNAVSSSQSNQL